MPLNFFVRVLEYTSFLGDEEPNRRLKAITPQLLLLVSATLTNSSIIPRYVESKTHRTKSECAVLSLLVSSYCSSTPQFTPRLEVDNFNGFVVATNNRSSRNGAAGYRDSTTIVNDFLLYPLVEVTTYFCKSLKTFSCGGVANEETVEEYLSKCVNLENLKLQGASLSRKKTFSSVFSKLNCKSLRRFQYVRLNDESLLFIAKECTNLISLDMGGCWQITFTGLTSAIKLMTNIEELQMNGAELMKTYGDEDNNNNNNHEAKSARSTFADFLLEISNSLSSSLRIFDLGDVAVFTSSATSIADREKVSAGYNAMKSLLRLETFVMSRSTFSSVPCCWADVCVGDQSLVEWSSGTVFGFLKNLYLGESPLVSDVGLAAILQGCGHSSLEKLTLRKIENITHDGFKPLLKTTNSSSNINYICISRCGNVASNVMTHFSQLPVLRTLILDMLPKVDDEALRILGTICNVAALDALTVQNCGGISPIGLFQCFFGEEVSDAESLMQNLDEEGGNQNESLSSSLSVSPAEKFRSFRQLRISQNGISREMLEIIQKKFPVYFKLQVEDTSVWY